MIVNLVTWQISYVHSSGEYRYRSRFAHKKYQNSKKNARPPNAFEIQIVQCRSFYIVFVPLNPVKRPCTYNIYNYKNTTVKHYMVLRIFSTVICIEISDFYRMQ